MSRRRLPSSAADPALRYQRLLERLEAAERARDELLTFAQYLRPDPMDVEDVHRSLYVPARPHQAIARALQRVESGDIRRLIITVPPRHGKTELASKLFIPWYIGRNPQNSAIFGTYNETYAVDIGRAVRTVLQSPLYNQVFPDVRLAAGSAASDRLEIEGGGMVAFAGRGGTITGRGGHLLVCDDPIKDRKEADSAAIRNQLWEWLQQVFKSRMMTDEARILLIQTRWHADDAVGRLIDPSNDFYHREEAGNWHVLDLPALALDNDPLGRDPGEPLWPERFGKSFLSDMQRGDPRGFSALYQGRPTPPGGQFFLENYLVPYQPHELPKDLRIYVASDHAVSAAQDRDKSCLIPVGVDAEGTIWVLPDVWWRHATTDVVVDAMLTMIRKRRPLAWWAERGHISKSIGPFLRKRMLEEQSFAAIHELVPVADKQTRAQSIQGRMAMRRVRFPVFAPWWAEAKQQLLTFPNGARDDFVDALAWVGLGLDTITTAVPADKPRPQQPMTLGAIKAASAAAARRAAARQGGF